MKTIYKYGPFSPGAVATIQMPLEAVVRCVDEQRDEVYLWAEVDTERRPEARVFACVGTGWNLDDMPPGERTYHGTAKCGPFVWHLYEVRP